MTKFARIPELGVNAQNLSGNDWHVYVVIAFHADKSGRSYPSLKRITAATGIDRRHISRSIARVEEKGLIRKQKIRCEDGGWDRSAYQIVSAAAQPALQKAAPVIVPQFDPPDRDVERDGGIAGKMFAIWKEECGDVLSIPRELYPRRIKSCLARFNDKFNCDLEQWRAHCREIRASTFCCGGGKKGWKADFDWALEPESIIKVQEGKYRDDMPPRRRAASNGPVSFDDYFVPPLGPGGT
jgi:Helix-turn-helix domain